MQTTDAQKQSGLNWQDILLLGLLLGLLEIGVVWAMRAYADRFYSFIVLLGIALYVLIPAIAGFLTSRQNGSILSGVGASCRVALVGWLSVSLALVIIAVLSTPSCCSRGLIDPVRVAEVATTVVIFLEGLCALIGSLLGGGLGSALGETKAPLSDENSENAEEPLS